MRSFAKTRERITDLLVSSFDIKRKDALFAPKEIEIILHTVLMEDGELSLPGIGTIAIVNTKEKVARNPQTGEKIVVPAHKALKLKTEAGMKKRLKETLV
jgi:nucleoid DNA-binding protein